MELKFFLPMIPPRTTAQQKRVAVSKNGKQVRYEGDALKDAHAKLKAYLATHRPQKPMDGALCLQVKWLFPDASRAHANGAYKITRPDTDNLQKLLKDVMTDCHYWHDDAQVACEIVEKFWVRSRPGIYVEVYTLEGVEEAGNAGN
ncbi:MAG: RusA family crossover junction endodeoxyribonuclease [Candidatus Ventricola sp.]